MSNVYEIRPHHCFTGWVIIFRNGQSIGARTSRLEAEEWIRRDKHIQSMKEREVRL
jgi:hypothetical protein